MGAPRGPSGPKKLRTFAATQYLEDRYWPAWTDVEKASLGDLSAMLAIIGARLDADGFGVADLYGILHDKDHKPDGSPKPDHVHLAGRAEDAGLSLPAIAKAVGVEPQYIEKLPPGRYSWPNALAYLIHIKYPEKHQYAPTEVVTFRGRDYVEIFEENRDGWMRGRASVERKSAEESRDYFVSLVNDGDLRVKDFEIAPKSDPKYAVWNEFERDVREAAKRAAGRRSATEVERLHAGEFEKNVMFLTGDSETGKTRTAVTLAESLAARHLAETGEKWHIFVAADKNSLDDYEGEQIVILDDHDGSGITGPGWKNFLNRERAAPISRRFHNGGPIAPRHVIICTTATPYEWMSAARGGSSQRHQSRDQLNQYIRRIEWLLRMDMVSLDEAPTVLAMMLRKLEGETINPIIDTPQMPDGSHRVVREELRYDFEPIGHFENPSVMIETLAPVLAMKRGEDRSRALAPLKAAAAQAHETAMIARAAEIGGQPTATHMAERHLAGTRTPDPAGNLFPLTTGGVHCGLGCAERPSS
jgi:hypothetical protein